MCIHDEARLPVILAALEEAKVIHDLAKMVAKFDTCLPEEQYEWGRDEESIPHRLRSFCQCTAELPNRDRVYELKVTPLINLRDDGTQTTYMVNSKLNLLFSQADGHPPKKYKRKQTEALGVSNHQDFVAEEQKRILSIPLAGRTKIRIAVKGRKCDQDAIRRILRL